MSARTTTFETRTYNYDDGGDGEFGPSPGRVAAYRADDWLARKQWGGISSCGWILIALIALLLIVTIIGIISSLVNRNRH